jgi:Lrp/AsnC family leucine-responsive transcriptional regulator
LIGLSLKNQKLLDAIGIKILRLLMDNARINYSEIARQVHLSTPAVIERIEKMEDAGIISGYHTDINPKSLGYVIQAVVMLTTDAIHYPTVQKIVTDTPEVETCDHVTGSVAFIMRVRMRSIENLENFIGQFTPIGSTQTFIIMSSLDTNHSLIHGLEE